VPFVDERGGRLQGIKLEFNLSFHCNYACAHCSHQSPYQERSLAELDHFRRDVQWLEQVYHVQRFRFVGGEPLLHPRLLDFIDVIKESDLADRVHLCTNGSLLHRASEGLYRRLDILSVSWYPDARCDRGKIDRARALCAAHEVELRVEPIRSFRAMDVDDPLPAATAQRVFTACQIAHDWSCQTFYEGRFYLCSRPLSTGRTLARKGRVAADFTALDGIDLRKPGLRERLRSYLARWAPLASCAHCLGTVGRASPWRALTAAERAVPAVVTASPDALLDRRRLTYLLAWSRVEQGVMRLRPSLRVARALSLLKSAPYHRARSRGEAAS